MSALAAEGSVVTVNMQSRIIVYRDRPLARTFHYHFPGVDPVGAVTAYPRPHPPPPADLKCKWLVNGQVLWFLSVTEFVKYSH